MNLKKICRGLLTCLAGGLIVTGGGASPKGATGSVVPLPTTGLKIQPLTSSQGTPMKGWSIALPGNRPLATPAIADGRLFIGGGFGSNEFYAFEASTGRPLWAIKVSDDGPTAAVVDDGCVVFNTESCTVFVVDAKTGKMLWSQWLGDPLMSQPAVGRGRVFMAYPSPKGHRLICLDLKTGHAYWDQPLAGDVISSPVLEGDSVYVTTFDGTVYRYLTQNGTCVWSQAYQATSAPWIAEGQIFVSKRESQGPTSTQYEGIAFVDPAKGHLLNGGNLLARREAVYLDPGIQSKSRYQSSQELADSSVGFGGGAPAMAKTASALANVGQGTVQGLWEFQGSRPCVLGHTCFNVMGNELQSVNLKTGQQNWKKPLQGDMKQLGGYLGTPPALLTNGKVLIGTLQGEILSFSAETGKAQETFAIQGSIRFQPAVVKGHVYVGTTTGHLLCIDTGDDTNDGWPMWGGSPAHNGPIR